MNYFQTLNENNRNLSDKIGIHFYLIIFLLLIPFYRFAGVSSFKFPLITLIIFLILLKKPIRYFDFQKTKLKGFLYLVLWCFLTIPFARSTSNTFDWIFDLVCYYLFYIILTKSIKSVKDVRTVDKVLVVFIIVELIFAVGQMLNISILFYYSEEQRGANAILSDEGGRYWGTFLNSLSLASFSSAIGVYLFSKYILLRSFFKAYFFLTMSLLLIILSGTRSGVISFIIPILMILLHNKKSILTNLFYIFLFFIAIYFMFGFESLFSSTLFQRSLDADDGRLLIWTNSLPVFFEHPIVGTTLGNLSSYLSEHVGLKSIFTIVPDSNSGHVENVYLTMLLSVGLIGFSLFIYQIILLRKRFKYLRENLIDSHSKITILSVRLALISISISMFFEPSYFNNQNSLLLLFVFISIYYSNYINQNIFNKGSCIKASNA